MIGRLKNRLSSYAYKKWWYSDDNSNAEMFWHLVVRWCA